MMEAAASGTLGGKGKSAEASAKGSAQAKAMLKSPSSATSTAHQTPVNSRAGSVDFFHTRYRFNIVYQDET